MPFGLCDAPVIFEKLMETILHDFNRKTCLIYLDDVIIYGTTFENHLEILIEVLKKLKARNLILNHKKCCLFQKKMYYLGRVISVKGVKTDPTKTKTIKTWAIPKDRHEIRSFLGLCTYYRKFMKGFADITSLLHKLIKNDQRFLWTDKPQEAFEYLKVKLCIHPLHYHTRFWDPSSSSILSLVTLALVEY